MTIDEIQEKIVADFEELGDSFDQYAYLIEISAAHEGLSDGDKTPERLVEGCQSRVWLKISTEGGIFSFSSDSDTLIVKGVLELLQQMLNGQTCADVSRAEVTFLQRTAIMDTFESDRQKGIGYVIRQLKKAAADADTVSAF